MKLLSVEVKNFKRFAGTARIAGLEPGLNVLFGRNELGKSTLMRAINAAIFERSKSTKQEVKDFRHIVNGTVPEVTLSFELGGTQWTVHKRFAYAGGKTLLEDNRSRRFEGDEAEDEIKRLFGFDPGAKPGEASIWGTLWVEQGQSTAGPTMSERARRTIEGCIESQIGAVVGGRRGQNIRESVRSSLDAILTGTTRVPKGPYKQTLADLEGAQKDIEDFERRRNEVDADFKRLTECQSDLKHLVKDLSGQDYEGQIAASDAARALAMKKSVEIQALSAEVELELTRASFAEGGVRERSVLLAEINQVQSDIDSRAQKVKEMTNTANVARDSVAAADAIHGERRATLIAARSSASNLERARAAVTLRADLVRLEGILKIVTALKVEHGSKLGAIAGVKTTDAAIERIEAAERSVQKAVATKDAAATAVTFDLTPTGLDKIKIDGKRPESSEFTRQVSSPSVIYINGVGSIQIEPKIKHITQLTKAIADAEAEISAALAAADVTSPDDARREISRRRVLEAEAKSIAAELRATLQSVGMGKIQTADDLSLAVDEVRGMFAVEVKQLGAEAPSDLDSLESALKVARKAADDAQGRADEAATKLTMFRSAEVQAVKEEAAIKAEVGAQVAVTRSKRIALNDLRAKESDDALTARAEGLTAQARRKGDLLSTKKNDPAADVAGPEARLSRLRNARDGVHQQIGNLNISIAGIEARIDANSGLGLDEKLAGSRAEQKRLDARAAAFKEESDVLTLLLSALEGAESESKSNYLSPVVDRIQPYLGMLLPGAQIVIDQNLSITGLKRGSLSESLFDLSLGTQEQLAVLTRLAFADLLRDQNRPATVILDDALVYSDDDRIERMFDILTRAAEKTQILVFTCRRRLFSQLGANMLDVEELQT